MRLDQAIGAAGPAAGAGGSSAVAGAAASSSAARELPAVETLRLAAAAGSSHARVQARHGLLIIFHPRWACRRRRSRRRWCARRPALDGEPRHARALRLREIVGAHLGETVDAPEKLQQARVGVGRHVVTAVSATGPERWQKSVEVFSGLRATVIIELRPESGEMSWSAATFVPSNPRIEFVRIPIAEVRKNGEDFELCACLQPAVAAYVCRPGDSTWRALAMDVLRIEDGLITEIVTFGPDSFPLFGLPMLMDPAPEMNMRH